MGCSVAVATVQSPKPEIRLGVAPRAETAKLPGSCRVYCLADPCRLVDGCVRMESTVRSQLGEEFGGRHVRVPARPRLVMMSRAAFAGTLAGRCSAVFANTGTLGAPRGGGGPVFPGRLTWSTAVAAAHEADAKEEVVQR
jgi:hypothetical protein